MGLPPPAAALSGHHKRVEVAAASKMLSRSACGEPGSSRQPDGLDLDALRADPALVEHVAVEELPAVLERCAVEHGRLAAVERLAHGRLRRELPALTRAAEGLLTARQAGRRLGVSPDYVRDHGVALGIAVELDGVTRYDPAAVEQLRRARRRDEPPRD
jgi:hypothetical protein